MVKHQRSTLFPFTHALQPLTFPSYYLKEVHMSMWMSDFHCQPSNAISCLVVWFVLIGNSLILRVAPLCHASYNLYTGSTLRLKKHKMSALFIIKNVALSCARFLVKQIISLTSSSRAFWVSKTKKMNKWWTLDQSGGNKWSVHLFHGRSFFFLNSHSQILRGLQTKPPS